MADEEEPANPGQEPKTDGGEAVHIHKPRPLHGLREFLSEIAVIVIGVLIALSAEQLVDQPGTGADAFIQIRKGAMASL